MLQLAICDDRSDDCRTLNEIVQAACPACSVHCFSDSALLLQEHLRVPFDIVLMDVLLEHKNGIDAAQQLYAAHPDVQIIFVSSSSEYMYDSYRVPHVWYIKKSDAALLLPTALQRAEQAAKQHGKQRFVVYSGGNNHVIFARDVLYFEQHSRKTFVHTKGAVYSKYCKISDYQKELDVSYFVQCHKSFLVNMECVRTYNRSCLTLFDGTTLPISRACFGNIQAYLIAAAREIAFVNKAVSKEGEENPL